MQYCDTFMVSSVSAVALGLLTILLAFVISYLTNVLVVSFMIE